MLIRMNHNPKNHNRQKSWVNFVLPLCLFFYVSVSPGQNNTADIIEQAAEKYSLPFVDQATAYRGKKNLFTDCVHLTTEGDRLKAQIFLDKIVELGLIKGDRQR